MAKWATDMLSFGQISRNLNLFSAKFTFDVHSKSLSFKPQQGKRTLRPAPTSSSSHLSFLFRFVRTHRQMKKKSGALPNSYLRRGTAKSLHGNMNGEYAAWIIHVAHHRISLPCSKLAVSPKVTIRCCVRFPRSRHSAVSEDLVEIPVGISRLLGPTTSFRSGYKVSAFQPDDGCSWAHPPISKINHAHSRTAPNPSAARIIPKIIMPVSDISNLNSLSLELVALPPDRMGLPSLRLAEGGKCAGNDGRSSGGTGSAASEE